MTARSKQKTNEYKNINKQWLEHKSNELDVFQLSKGVLYKIISSKNDKKVYPTPQNVVVVHYVGKTIDGKIFDSSIDSPPFASRLSDLIEGWIIALQKMTPGDKWEIYIPSELGYGKYSQPDIPAHSTLIFEIELIGIY